MADAVESAGKKAQALWAPSRRATMGHVCAAGCVAYPHGASASRSLQKGWGGTRGVLRRTTPSPLPSVVQYRKQLRAAGLSPWRPRAAISVGREMVDITCQDAFYENLTLGLIKLLTQTPGVQDVRLDKRTPCERLLLSSWEQRHCCALPDDLRQFYLSTDGFSLTWNYQHAGQVIPLGNMRVNAITELRRLAGVKSLGDADGPTLLDVEICSTAGTAMAAASASGAAAGASVASVAERPNFGVKCKIFELDPCQGMAKVCLVYLDKGLEPRRPEPRIWLLDRCFEWHFLAADFTTYFRMMLVHQGLPLWQFRATPMGLTPWAEQMFTLVAPHLLLVQPETNAHALPTIEWGDAPYNHLDPTIFKTRSKVKKK